MSCERVDTACCPMLTNATREGRKLHGHVVSGLARVPLPRSGLPTTVTVLPVSGHRTGCVIS